MFIYSPWNLYGLLTSIHALLLVYWPSHGIAIDHSSIGLKRLTIQLVFNEAWLCVVVRFLHHNTSQVCTATLKGSAITKYFVDQKPWKKRNIFPVCDWKTHNWSIRECPFKSYEIAHVFGWKSTAVYEWSIVLRAVFIMYEDTSMVLNSIVFLFLISLMSFCILLLDTKSFIWNHIRQLAALVTLTLQTIDLNLYPVKLKQWGIPCL